MTKRKTLLFCCVFALTSAITAQGQTKFEVPQNVAMNTEADYAKYEKAIIDAAKWLETTDLNKETGKRQEVNAFVVQWITGSPTVTVDINENLGALFENNTQLLGIYLASYTSNFLEQKSVATKFSAVKAGLTSMMSVYKKGIEINKNKTMDQLIKLTAEQKLDQYINEHFIQ